MITATTAATTTTATAIAARGSAASGSSGSTGCLCRHSSGSELRHWRAGGIGVASSSVCPRRFDLGPVTDLFFFFCRVKGGLQPWVVQKTK